MDSTNHIALSREQLHEKVWAAPATQVAAELGISDVALAKRCKKLNVPKPSPGYWAKIAAGRRPCKRPLPPTPSELFIQAAEKKLKRSLSLPETTEQLHPLATELLHQLTAAKPDWEKRNSVCLGTLPEVRVYKPLIDRVPLLELHRPHLHKLHHTHEFDYIVARYGNIVQYRARSVQSVQ